MPITNVFENISNILKFIYNGDNKWLWGFPDDSDSKESAYNSGDPGLVSGWGRPLEKGIAARSRILVWKILWTEEPGD